MKELAPAPAPAPAPPPPPPATSTTSFYIPLMCDQDIQLNSRKPKKDAISESKPNSLHRCRSRSLDGASRPPFGSQWQELRRLTSTPNSSSRSRPKWHYVMFGPAKVPSKMDMKDMHDRQVRNNLCQPIQRISFSKTPWKFLQSLSCKAIEIGVVAEPPLALHFIPNMSS